MSEVPNKSSGEFRVPRLGITVRDTVVFPEGIAEQVNVSGIINRISLLKPNPCAECSTIFDLVSILAQRTGIEPEEMGLIEIACQPDGDNPGFYRVDGNLSGILSQVMTSVRCQLLRWVVQQLELGGGKLEEGE